MVLKLSSPPNASVLKWSTTVTSTRIFQRHTLRFAYNLCFSWHWNPALGIVLIKVLSLFYSRSFFDLSSFFFSNPFKITGLNTPAVILKLAIVTRWGTFKSSGSLSHWLRKKERKRERKVLSFLFPFTTPISYLDYTW